MAILGAILAIGFLVLVHEAGHYFAARWCKMRIERFSIGFGPAISSWPRRERVIEETASGVDEVVAALYRLARQRPRGRAGVSVGRSANRKSKNRKVDWNAAELASLPLAAVTKRVTELMAAADVTEATAQAWDQVDFTLGPIPFGGFVQIDGMALAEDVDPQDEHAYPNRPVWQRALTIFAGPATNFVVAIVLGVVVFSVAGVQSGYVEYTVEGLADGYDAQGKLEEGDRILRIDGERIRHDESHGGLPEVIQEHRGSAVSITVLRDGEPVDVSVVPRPAPESSGFWATLGKDYARSRGQEWPAHYLIGIEMTELPERTDVGIGGAVKEALAYPVDKSEMILVGLWKIVTREEKGQVGGPVMITAMIKRSIDYGWVELFTMLMLLNVYLGLFNLLPLPALDGGRLAFLGYEVVTRRRPNPSIEQTVHAVGIMAFLVIMVLVTYKDIVRLFS